MLKVFCASLLVVSVASLGCAPEPPLPLTAVEKAAIRTTATNVVALYNAANFEAAVPLGYADDAVTMPPNAAAVSGRPAILAFLKSFPPFTDFKVDMKTIEGLGDLAYVYGTYSMMVTPPGATAPTKDEGKYVEIWRRQKDGAWKVILDSFNSDLPLSAPPPPPVKK